MMNREPSSPSSNTKGQGKSNKQGRTGNSSRRRRGKEKKKGQAPQIQPGKLAIFGARKATSQPGGELPEDSPADTKPVAQPPSPPVTPSTPLSSTPLLPPAVVTGGAEVTKEKTVKLVDDISRWCGPVDLLQSESSAYRVIGVLGEQSSGKSWVLNCLGAKFPVETEEDRARSSHKTEGIDIFPGSIGGERVLFLDTRPVFSPSVISSLMQHVDVLAEHRDSHAVLSSVHELQLCVFLLTVCDVVLVVQDYGANQSLWNLVRMAYLVKTGDALTTDCADLILVKNRVPTCELNSLNELERAQLEWVAYFGDLIPHAAMYPRLGFAALGSYDSLADAQSSPQVLYLTRVLLFDCFESAICGTPFGTPDLLFFDEDEVERRGTFSFLHRLHSRLTEFKAKKREKKEKQHQARLSVVQSGLRTNRPKESGFVATCAKVWSKDIMESVQMREFMAMFRAQQAFIL